MLRVKTQMLNCMKLVVSSSVMGKELPDEVEYLSGILTGQYVNHAWQSKKVSRFLFS